MIDKLTVVVTNYQRPEHLRKCLQSVKDAGVLRVVVSTTAPSEEVEAVNASFFDKFPDFQVVSTPEDLGCNENWLRGAYYATTPYILILHDDDWLSATFGEVFKNVICPQLDRGVGFASWRGDAVQPDGTVVDIGRYVTGPTRVVSSGTITKVLLKPDALSLSPVVSVFRRNDVIRILKEAGELLRVPQCYTRPTMMVGNDLLLYLRHAEKYSSFLYLDSVLSFYGAHPGSETIKAFTKKRNPLIPAYNYAREVFCKVRGPQVNTKPRLIHVFSDYPATDEGTTRRNAVAKKTWEFQYGKGFMLPCPVYSDDLPRSSRDVGDTRDVPYIKDLIAVGMAMAVPGDRVVLSNRDTCFVRGASEILRDWKTEAAYGVRRDLFHPISENASVLDDITYLGAQHCGADLISISPDWWSKWKDWMPDMLLAYECWDLMAKELIHETLPGAKVDIADMIYHEYHETFWALAENRYKHPAQVYALRQAKNFYYSRARHITESAATATAAKAIMNNRSI